ncbi:hypothetical protein Tco_0928710 [Tanacetum coccineum]
MENSKRESIPMQDKLRLSKSQGTSTPAKLKCMQNVSYASVVGSIMYAVRCTRSDVAFAHNITSRFQQNPELGVSCYTDAGYLTDADDLKSQTGYVFILNRGAVDRKSAKQSIFATSSAEAEYIVAYDACDNRGLSRYVRLDNQSIERDRLIGIGFVLHFIEFISFTFGDKEMILVIEPVSR